MGDSNTTRILYTPMSEANMYAIHPETGKVIGTIQVVVYQYTIDEDSETKKSIAGNIVFNTIDYTLDKPFIIVINDYNNKNITVLKNVYILTEGTGAEYNEDCLIIKTEYDYVFVASEIEETDEIEEGVVDEQENDK